jgi:hypothetical protein
MFNQLVTVSIKYNSSSSRNLSKLLSAFLPDYNFMGNGWSLLNRKIDDYDVEWTTWKNLVTNYWFCFVIHAVSAEMFRYLKLEVRKFYRSRKMFADLSSIFSVHFSLVLHRWINIVLPHVQHSISTDDVPSNAHFVYHQLVYQQKVSRVVARRCMARDTQLS